jgi:hypothetical protein
MDHTKLKNTDKVQLLAAAIKEDGSTIMPGEYEVSELTPEILEAGRWRLATPKDESSNKKANESTYRKTDNPAKLETQSEA